MLLNHQQMRIFWKVSKSQDLSFDGFEFLALLEKAVENHFNHCCNFFLNKRYWIFKCHGLVFLYVDLFLVSGLKVITLKGIDA